MSGEAQAGVEAAWEEVKERLNREHAEKIITYRELKIGVNNASLIRDAALAGSQAALAIVGCHDTIGAANVEELRKALEPFALFAIEGKSGGRFIICKALFEDMRNWDDSPPRSAHLHIDDFLRARFAFATLSSSEPTP